MSECKHRLFSIGDNLFVLLLCTVILSYCLGEKCLLQQMPQQCLESGACEYGDGDWGGIVIRLKTRQEKQ